MTHSTCRTLLWAALLVLAAPAPGCSSGSAGVADGGGGDGAAGLDAAGPVDGGPDGGCVDIDLDGHLDSACGGDDCDDRNASAFPGGEDRFGDGRDQDCSGADGTDADQDGHASVDSGGGDCDDDDPAIHPGLPDDGEWQEETVTWEVHLGERPTVDIGPDGAAHVAAQDTGADELRYWTNATGSWEQDVVHSAAAYSPRLAVDSSGTVHVAFVAFPYVVTHAYGRAQDFREEVVDDLGADGTLHLSAALDADDSLRVAYVAAGELLLANQGAPWAVDVLASGLGLPGPTAIAVDSAGVPHVIYRDLSRLLTHVAVGSEPETIDPDLVDTLAATAIAIDPATDAVHVAYEGNLMDHPGHATNASGRWDHERVGDETLERPSIAVGARGAVHVVFTWDSDVRFATTASGEWSVDDVAWGSLATMTLHDGVTWVVYWRDPELRIARRNAPDGVDDDCNGVVW